MQFFVFLLTETHLTQSLNLPASSLDCVIAEFETLQNRSLYNGKADTALSSVMRTMPSYFPLLLKKLGMVSSKTVVKKR